MSAAAATRPGPFRKMPWKVGVDSLQAELAAHPELWDQRPERRIAPGSPHAEMVDIWVRYRDMAKYRDEHGGDMSKFCDEHESVWMPPADVLPSAVLIAGQIIGHTAAPRLGGILITKLAPGGMIYPHVDGGWHAGFYDKFYVAVRNPPGARFCFEGGSFEARDGDVFWFRNDVSHWVENDSGEDRIAMVVCVRRAGR